MHALGLAVELRGKFVIVLSDSRGASLRRSAKFPAVRDTLEQWGKLRPNSPQSAVFEEWGTRVKKVSFPGEGAELLPDYLDQESCDLLVLAKSAHLRLPSWVRHLVTRVGPGYTAPAILFVPNEPRSFVSVRDGSLRLKRFLVAVTRSPSPDRALAWLVRFSRTVTPSEPLEFVLLHVGKRHVVGLERLLPRATHSADPRIELETRSGSRWHRRRNEDDVASEIIAVAEEIGADSIVLTMGCNSEAQSKSVTGRLLSRSLCPVFVLSETANLCPIGSVGFATSLTS